MHCCVIAIPQEHHQCNPLVACTQPLSVAGIPLEPVTGQLSVKSSQRPAQTALLKPERWTSAVFFQKAMYVQLFVVSVVDQPSLRSRGSSSRPSEFQYIPDSSVINRSFEGLHMNHRSIDGQEHLQATCYEPQSGRTCSSL